VHRRVDEVLAECQESLVYNVNPAIVMDWLATRVALLCSARR
jgi:DNA polymerase-3 subunit delta'